MKNLIAIIACATTFAAFGEGEGPAGGRPAQDASAASPAKAGTVSATDAALKERIRAWKAESGGYVAKADPANGKVVIVNKQSRVDEKALKATAKYYKEFTSNMPFVVAENDRGATFAIIVNDDEGDSHMMSIWPEERRAAVNVAVLAKGTKDAVDLEMRTRKEVSRAIALLVGGGSQHEGTLAGSLTGAKALDRYKDDAMPPDVFMRIGINLRAADVRPIYRVTYLQACQEGWAPEPANDRQKAIWDKVHTMPTEPIKIKPETKKQAR